MKHKFLLFVLCALLVGAVNGFFGGGGGMLCIPILKKVLNLCDKNAHASTIFIMSVISIPTLIIYLCLLPVDIIVTTYVTIGSIIGGGIGSLILKKIDNKSLNLFFVILLLACAIRCFV